MMTKRPRITIEGYTAAELLSLPDADVDRFVFCGEAIIIRLGSAIILGEFRRTATTLVVELAQIEGGGEGVLPAFWRLVHQYAAQRGLARVEWIMHAVACAQPNLKLKRVLDARGFVVEDVPGGGTAYHLVTPTHRPPSWAGSRHAPQGQ